MPLTMNSLSIQSKTIKFQKIAPNDAIDMLDVQKIFQGRKKVTLNHNGDKYILQITGNNKLLLTK